MIHFSDLGNNKKGASWFIIDAKKTQVKGYLITMLRIQKKIFIKKIEYTCLFDCHIGSLKQLEQLATAC